MLISLPRSLYQEATATDVQKSKIVAILYVMETLKNQSASKPDQNILPYRTYIWEGKAGKYLNGDGDIKNVAANLTAIPPTPEYKEEGWCFTYGEKEWVGGKVFDDVKKAANPTDSLGRPRISTGTLTCI